MKRSSVVCLLCSIAASRLPADFSAIRSRLASASTAPADRGRPACARRRCRPVARRACHRGLRYPSPAARRSAAAPACAAPDSRGRHCSAPPPRPHCAQRAKRRPDSSSACEFARRGWPLSRQDANDFRNHVAGPANDDAYRRYARPCAGSRPRCAGWRWSPSRPRRKPAASRATGVSAPVRPTWIEMSSSSVTASSAGNLWARAKRGARETKPRRSCAARSSTL
jgi:hypothetical protein